MNIDPNAGVVLCYGDSNTYGVPAAVDDPDRVPPDQRWTGVLQKQLGSRFAVIEEGLPGRTTDVDYVDRPGCNGWPYFRPCLLSHHPVEVVMIMLGTNDLKHAFGRTPREIADALPAYVDEVRETTTTRSGATPRILLISPIWIDDTQADFH